MIVSVAVALVNSYSTNLAARVQIVFTVAKLVALVIIIVGGIVKLAEGKYFIIFFFFFFFLTH